MKELQELSPKIYLAPLVASEYCEVKEDWLVEMSAWVNKVCGQIRDGAPDSPANACHAFATTVRFATQFAALVTAENEPLVATLIVQHKQKWANVIAFDKPHAVVIFRTKDGWVVMEAQNGIRCYLKDYPDRHHLIYASVH